MENVPVQINDVAHKSPKGFRHPGSKKPRSRAKTVILSIAAVLIIAVIAVGGLWLVKNAFGSPIKSGQYQAVFLTSGQVYFGKLDKIGGEYSRLTDVFYIQATEADEAANPQEGEADTTDLQLIKLGSEVHGPEDEMIVNKEQILFVENLKEDGKVSQSIKQYYSAAQN